jgi:coenzyme Q-binding protein COQ10
MPRYTVTRRVKLTPEQAYAIASDVTAYKDFVPLVRRAVIRSPRIETAEGERFEAELVVAYDKLHLRESFVSKVLLEPQRHRVTARSSDGPVKHLETIWQISPAGPGGSDVAFTIDYTMRSLPLQLLIGSVFNLGAERILNAFEERGRKLYPTTVA